MFMPSGVVAAAVGGESQIETLTAGGLAATRGFLRGNYGVLDPDAAVFEYGQYHSILSLSGSALFVVAILNINIPDSDDSWRSIKISGDFGAGVVTNTYQRTDRSSYIADNGLGATRWEFTEQDIMLDGNVYTLEISR